MPRLFVAVEPSAEACTHLESALSPLQGAAGEPRWIPPERWHLTLLFLGAVADDDVAGLLGAVGDVAGAAPLTLWIAGAGRFGSGRRPQVFWTGLDGDVGALTGLADRLRSAVAARGFATEDRPFRAHLTVGRWRPGRPADPALPDRLADYRGPAWPVTEVCLMESHLGRDARYEVVAGWPVGGAPS
ncbi:MAG: 2,3-cyclic 3-phosphodiesterase [Blastococcus sp.]|jgi:2'-5' RNA ligase|nr:2,3-cyclic 3-phosphodiesterase [Blastococcus sp.]